MVRCVFFSSFFENQYLIFLSHSQESDSEFVLVHDDELIGMLERDAAALDLNQAAHQQFCMPL